MGTNKGIDSNSHNGDPVELSETNDLYGYYKPVRALAKTLGACSTPFVVGIYGRWGRGKSTYLNSLKAELDRSGGESRGFQHYQYSPWQYQLESFTDACDNLGTFRMSEMSRLRQPEAGLGEVTEI
jgi:ATPase subunit of ABC transporter with duplicated ATPase domains